MVNQQNSIKKTNTFTIIATNFVREQLNSARKRPKTFLLNAEKLYFE